MKKFSRAHEIYLCDLVVDGNLIKNQFLDWKTIQRFKSMMGVQVLNQKLVKGKKQ